MAANSSTLRQRRSSGSCNWSVPIWVLLLTNLLVFQLTFNARQNDISSVVSFMDSTTTAASLAQQQQQQQQGAATTLSIPQGYTPNLPSITISNTNGETNQGKNKKDKKDAIIYGGKGVDKSHLGGWTDMDHHGISPAAWKHMVTNYGIQSLMDVGCGRGFSASWFDFHGLDQVLCVEGSHDARQNTVLRHPETQMIEHDFSRGPWWPSHRTFDAIWCVEFLEHVGRNFHKNYLPLFRKAALIFVTHSNWGGYHHVEVHSNDWWVTKFTMYGFIYSDFLTKEMRAIALKEKQTGVAPNGVLLNAQHVWLNLKVFINPLVASLPEHAHLMAEPGCFWKRENGGRLNRDCGSGQQEAAKTESTLPPGFRPIELTEQMDVDWFNYIKPKVKQREPKEEVDKLNEMSRQRTAQKERSKL